MIKTLFVVVLVAFSSVIYAQVNDAGLWTDISIEKSFNKSFSVKYSNSERFNENVTELGSFINAIGIKYKINKKNRIAVYYRLKYKHALDNTYYPIRRFYIDYTYKFGLWKFDVDLRLRAQSQQTNTVFYSYDSKSNHVLRPRVKLSFKYLKFKPYLLCETYHPVWNNKYQPCEKIRGVMGLEYSLNKKSAFDLGYMIQKEMFEKNPVTDFVFVVGYKFKF